MNTHDHLQGPASQPRPDTKEVTPPRGRSLNTALLMVALVVGVYLLREHWSHVAGNWIYLLLLACPLMHLFHGHGGHGGHRGHGGQGSGPRDDNGNDKG